MSNALADVSSSLRTVVETGASTLADLVDEARSRLDDLALPQLARARRRQTRKRIAQVAVIAAIAVIVAMVVQRGRRHDVDPVDQSSVRHR
jgi:hypothetical protein